MTTFGEVRAAPHHLDMGVWGLDMTHLDMTSFTDEGVAFPWSGALATVNNDFILSIMNTFTNTVQCCTDL